MKGKIRLAVQVLFGMIILAAGVNKFYLFMPVPEQMPAGKEFIDFLYATGYLMYVVAVVEIVGGGLIISNRLTPLALLLLAPVTTNILLFHIFLEQKGLPMGIFIFTLYCILFGMYRQKFRDILKTGASENKVKEPEKGQREYMPKQAS